jgi:hypothetical protein
VGPKRHVLVMSNIPNSSNRGARNTRRTSIPCHVHVLSGITLYAHLCSPRIATSVEEGGDKDKR